MFFLWPWHVMGYSISMVTCWVNFFFHLVIHHLKKIIAMDFCLCGAILNLKSVCLTACVGPPGLPPSGPK